jgi:hypothetical protein
MITRRVIQRIALRGGALSLLITALACGPAVRVDASLKVESFASGWVPIDATPGQSKLVPAISFRLRNVSEASLPTVQVNAIFHRGDDGTEWGNAFQTAAGSEGLDAGAASRHVLLASQTGYTGSDIPADLIENSQFVDARVDLFGRYGSKPWTKLGEYAVVRVLMNP